MDNCFRENVFLEDAEKLYVKTVNIRSLRRTIFVVVVERGCVRLSLGIQRTAIMVIV